MGLTIKQEQLQEWYNKGYEEGAKDKLEEVIKIIIKFYNQENIYGEDSRFCKSLIERLKQ